LVGSFELFDKLVKKVLGIYTTHGIVEVGTISFENMVEGELAHAQDL
jgi:hypothetical protein